MREVFVAGVGMIRFGRYPDRDVPDLGAEAALLALADAGLTMRDVGLLAAGAVSSRRTRWSASASSRRWGRRASRW